MGVAKISVEEVMSGIAKVNNLNRITTVTIITTIIVTILFILASTMIIRYKGLKVLRPVQKIFFYA